MNCVRKNLISALSLVFVIGFAVFSKVSSACPSVAFNAKNADGETIAQIRGDSILSSGWTSYFSKQTSKYTITRYRKFAAGNFTLWLYKKNNPADQPGILWILWYDAGIFEGPINKYAIATNLRSAPGQHPDGVSDDSNVRFDKNKDWWVVGCQ